jgi:hypothetical protein
MKHKDGLKFDTGKLRYDLIPWDVMDEVAYILTFGAKKYEPRNWEKGMDWGRLSGAVHRHMALWEMAKIHGTDGKDPETGRSHLAGAHCSLMFLHAYELRNIGNDDRAIIY